ncbi:cytochrome c maturation protein CcmE [Aquabacterium olei]|uniref:Cytochrome c-type biogenesis protein CcmE n=1 Tax=Aquabacterium olei TaxID=1296669 RepID=A0A2U8FTZ5_9BURK|nr:cytochrome c maturation protein CcmE [Aquabacterium olei]AWI54525.1 cytochrome c maturation protein CcmE [Aquabacterium olei]
MKPRQQRLALALGGVAVLGLAVFFVLQAFQQNLVFFFTPSQISRGEAPVGRSFRIGGMVEAGSHRREANGLGHRFVVTDAVQRVEVQYAGLLPDLFKEGKGVVAQGRLQADGRFAADEVLAKHDENYMPPEAARALEQARAPLGAKER